MKDLMKEAINNKDCIRSYQYMVFDILDKMEQESKNKRDK